MGRDQAGIWNYRTLLHPAMLPSEQCGYSGKSSENETEFRSPYGRLVVPLVSPLGCLRFPITMVISEGGILDFRCENFGFYLIESLLPLHSPARIFKLLKT